MFQNEELLFLTISWIQEHGHYQEKEEEDQQIEKGKQNEKVQVDCIAPPSLEWSDCHVSYMELQTRAGVALSIVNAPKAVIVIVVFSIY